MKNQQLNCVKTIFTALCTDPCMLCSFGTKVPKKKIEICQDLSSDSLIKTGFTMWLFRIDYLLNCQKTCYGVIHISFSSYEMT